MHARIRARRRRRPAIAALGVALVVVLGACDTQPATDVTHNAATLNARGACYGTMNGIWQYELRRVGGPWNSVGPLHPFACGASGAETAIQSHRATGLAPNTTYQYRIRAYENNSAREYFFDSTGADRGTNYDQFRTHAAYPTSWNYGGTNQRVDTDPEVLSVVNAMAAASDGGAALWAGLAPGDQTVVQQRGLTFASSYRTHETLPLVPENDEEQAHAAAGRCKHKGWKTTLESAVGRDLAWIKQTVYWCWNASRTKLTTVRRTGYTQDTPGPFWKTKDGEGFDLGGWGGKGDFEADRLAIRTFQLCYPIVGCVQTRTITNDIQVDALGNILPGPLDSTWESVS